uniref:SusC/RagA family TonB-linked outer membrane protein n=1 Tax=Prevotella sp. TaxID=59823 RepID=UPI003FEF7F74
MKRTAALCLVGAFCSLNAQAQKILVKGNLVDGTGEPLIGATVKVKGNAGVGAVTDLDGNFSISVPSENSTLVFTYVGMKTKEVKVGSKREIKLTLEDDNAIGEVVVVGYGQQKKASVVGAITQTTGKVLERAGGVSDIGSALTGNLPGVITSSSSGMPGDEDPKIVIRGVSSWNSSDPLILVDGIERPMSSVDIHSVQSISVLKDASATAVYGVKGANGVILITTKRGTEGKAKISASASSAIKLVSKLPETYGSADALYYANQAVKHELGLSPSSWGDIRSTEFINKYNAPAGSIDPETGLLMSERYPDVDWQKELFKDYAMSYNANVNIAGGTKAVKYYAAIDYQHEGDLFREWNNNRGYTSGYGFNRINVRSNLDFQLTKTTTLKANLSGSHGIRKSPYGLDKGSWAETQLWQAAYSAPHDTFLPQYSDGVWGYFPKDEQGSPNSVTQLALHGEQSTTTTRINTDFTLEQDLSFITKGLKASAIVSWDNVFVEASRGINDLDHAAQYKYIDPVTGVVTYKEKPGGKNNFDFTETIAWKTDPGALNNGLTQRNLFYQAQLYWGRKFGKHDVTAMGVFNRSERATGSEFTNYREDWAFRTTYNYADRYMFEYNGAYNGSEKFSKDNRFAFFNSGAIGWNVANEKWFKPVTEAKVFGRNLVDILKFRYSYGEIGEDNVWERWLYQTTWAYGGKTHLDSTNPNNESIYTWYKESKVGNPDIHWEKAIKQNFGIDYAFLGGLVAGSLEFFNEKRSDIMIAGNSRSVPSYFGASAPYLNKGRTKTTGYELEVRLKYDFANGIHAYANMNMTHARNVVTEHDDPVMLPSYQKNMGFSIGQAKSYLDNGTAQSWDDVIAMTPHNTNDDQKLPGQYIITDFNGDGVIDTNDSAPYGFTGTPQNTYNATIGIDYKGFSIYAQFYGVNNVSRYVAFNSLPKSYVHTVFKEGAYWSPSTPDGIPSLRMNSTPSYYEGTRFLYDGSFCRLKNLEVAYTWNDGWIKSLGLSMLKVYVNGNNLFLWTDMPDDRESNFAGTGLASQGAYPTMKRINFGIKLEL